MTGRPEYEETNEENNIEKHYGGADMIVTAKHPETDEDMILIEKVFRVPTGHYVLSFPAGSKDPTDPDPGFTALRELKEETGYTGTVINWSLSHRADPWKSVGRTKTVHIDVDLSSTENQLDNVLDRQDMEPDEDIVSEWLPIDGLLE